MTVKQSVKGKSIHEYSLLLRLASFLSNVVEPLTQNSNKPVPQDLLNYWFREKCKPTKETWSGTAY